MLFQSEHMQEYCSYGLRKVQLYLQMLTVPELKALAVGMDLKLGSRNSSNRQAMLAWYSRTLLSPAPGSTVSSSTRAYCYAMLQTSDG